MYFWPTTHCLGLKPPRLPRPLTCVLTLTPNGCPAKKLQYVSFFFFGLDILYNPCRWRYIDDIFFGNSLGLLQIFDQTRICFL